MSDFFLQVHVLYDQLTAEINLGEPHLFHFVG